MKVYLDTSAWNWLVDWSARRSRKRVLGPEYLFSSCNLDEFGLAGNIRSRDLAAFAWSITNRKRLQDHLDIHSSSSVPSSRANRRMAER
ncbi:MAG: hypothetical protein O7H41_00145 [Planctomycetota bacterium]|nr:hypothetical protein [Planctomycetota bacterium]